MHAKTGFGILFCVFVCAFLSTPLQAQLPVTDSLVFWLDASNTSSIVSADGSLNSGDQISQWNDILIGSNTSSDNAAQADSSKQPVWIGAQPWANNASVVRFNGSATYLNTPTLFIGSSMTIFVVSQAAVQTVGSVPWQRSLISSDDVCPWDESYLGTGYGMSYSHTGKTSMAFSLADTGYGTNNVQSNDVTQDFKFNIITARRDNDVLNGTQLYLRRSGDPNFVLKASGQFLKIDGLTAGYDIGACPPERQGGHMLRSYSGDIAEIIIYNKKLSDAELKQVGDYLYGKYLDPKVCGRPETVYLPGDLNKDCSVGLKDIALIMAEWLECSNSQDNACSPANYDMAEMAKNRWTQWRRARTQFPIAAWSYFSRYAGSAAEYEVYADAGLNMVQNPIYHYEAAKSANLNSLIGAWENLHKNPTKLEYYVNFPTSTDANVIGYLIKDEPREATEIAEISMATHYIYLNDRRNAIPIVNLLPGFGSYTGFDNFADYVNTYVSVVNPAVISYDHYPVLADGTDRPTFYSDMETVRSAALNAGIGFMGFTLVSEYNGGWSYRLPSESDLNWMTYSLLTYGAQGLFYWNYRIEPTDVYREGLVTHADGTPTSMYYLVQTLNTEIQKIGHILMDLKTTGVFHTADTLPEGATPYANGSISAITNLSATNYLVGQFINADDATDNDVYLMLMNKRHGAGITSASQSASATFTVNAAYPYVYKHDPATGNLVQLSGSGGTYTVTLGGGKAVLIRLSADVE